MVERTLISLPSQLQLIDRLQHLIYLSSSLIFVSGEPGSGKSTLIENLSNVLPSDLQQVYISLVNEQSIETLRQQIVTQLYEKPLFNAEDRLSNTIERLHKTKSETQNTLIIIDNTHNLPSEFALELCELFSNVSLSQDNTFNLLLLADEAVNEGHLEYINSHLIGLEQSQLNHIELTLPAIPPREASALLQHNFQQADYQAELQHQDALNQQLNSCNGNPEKIIKLAEDLSQGVIKDERNSWVKTRLPAILLMLFLVSIVAVLANYLYPKFIINESGIKKSNTVLIDSDVSSIEHNDVSLVGDEQQEAMAGSWAASKVDITDNKDQVGLSDTTEKRIVISNQQLVELTVLAEDTSKIYTGLSQAESTEKVHPASLQIQQESYDEKPLPIIDNSDAEQSAPHYIDLQEVNLENTEEGEVESSQDSTSVDIAREAKSVSVPSTIENSSSPFTNSDVLLSKNADHFTVQLSGMASKKSLARFKAAHNLPQKNVFVYQTIRQNNAFFIVTYGDYDSFEQASLATKNLPSTFKGMSTWIKKWQVVHNDLRLNDE